MAKKIFVSASSGEAAVSRALITALSNAFEGDLTFANSAVDMGAGDKWKAWMRSNLKDCDAGLFLLTPAYNKSPWSSAEFTAFWLDEKPIFLLMAGASIQVSSSSPCRMTTRQPTSRTSKASRDSSESL